MFLRSAPTPALCSICHAQRNGRTALHRALERGRATIAAALVAHPTLDVGEKLVYFAYRGDSAAVTALLAQPALPALRVDVNALGYVSANSYMNVSLSFCWHLADASRCQLIVVSPIRLSISREERRLRRSLATRLLLA